jgi:RNA polymerase primary sigma factor
MGLMKGTQKFDGRKGYKFSTYVTWWIKQALGRAVQQYGRVIYVPAYAHEGHNKIQKARYRLYQELGRWPTDEEVEADIGAQREGSWDVEQIDTVASLDEPFENGDADDAYLGNLVADPESDNAAKVERIRLREEIDQCLMLLKPSEEAVIRLRFGLNDAQRDHTLREVGLELRLTRERIRQIEQTALTKLRSPAVRESLKDFY